MPPTSPKSRRPTTVVARHAVLVDSGAWIALASPRDQHHDEADALIRAALGRRVTLLTTNLIVAEVHRFLLFRAGVAAALGAIERIERSAIVSIEFVRQEEHRAALEWLQKLRDRKISYTDATSFATMEARRCRAALTFDDDFLVAGFEIWRPA